MSGQVADETLQAWIEAGAALLGIPVDPAWRADILLHLRISLGHAGNVLQFPLPDEAEPAPVFEA